MAHITLSQLTTVLQRIVSWATGKFAAKNTYSGKLEYADMPVVVLASMGSELDGTSTQRPMSAGDTYYLPAGQGAGARIMFVDSIGTAVKISDPVSNVIYCNAYTGLLYRWDASEEDMVPVGGTSSGSIDVSGKADLLAGTGMLSPAQWPKVVLRNVSDTMLDDLASGDVYFDTGHLYLYKGDNQNPVDLGEPSSKIIYFCLADGKMYRWNGNTFQPILATVATSGSYNDLSNKPTLFSGNYNDLSNKPTIPDVSGLATKTEVTTGLATKQDALTFDNAPTANSNNVVRSGGIKQAIDDKLTEVALTEISGAADIVVIDDADLAFIDQQGNIAMQVADGHIQTSEFDSAQVKAQVAANTASVASINQQIAGIGGQSDVAVKNEDDAPFDISDAGGNVVLRVNGRGHIQTKGYDSQFAAMTLETPMCICHAVSSPLGNAYNHTMKHFRTAIARGHQFIECDGYNCMDGVPVCAHDDSYSFYVKESLSGERASKSFSSINSADLIAGYTWTAPTIEDGVITEYGEPIIKVTDLLYFVCYIHRCNLYIDAKGMNTQSVKDVLDYAESIGCRQLVWIEPSNNNISLSGVQCNICVAGVTLETMASKVAANKRDGYNLMLHLVSTTNPGPSRKTRREFAAAAHSYGCYAYTWSMNSAQTTRDWFDDGFDFIFTEGYTTVTWYITKYTVFNLQ